MTAVAAKKLGRKFIAFEIDKNYVRISRDKLSRTNIITKVGASFVSVYRNNIATIRDIDWEKIKKHFIIPKPISLIDHCKIELKEKNLLDTKLQKVKRITTKKKTKSKIIKISTIVNPVPATVGAV